MDPICWVSDYSGILLMAVEASIIDDVSYRTMWQDDH